MKNFLCNKCGKCCTKIKADKENKILYWDGVQPLRDLFADMLIPADEGTKMYKCKYLLNNECTNHNKPEECINYPLFPFTELPDGCGYYGEMFLKNEKIKQKIRKLKEEIIHYNAIIETTKDKHEQNQLKKIISSHNKFIDKYKQNGSSDW